MRHRRMFTLVELLVVIAIISLLASLLAPALLTAKIAANRIACVNNLRNIGISIHNYVDDHNGYTPPCDYSGSLNPWTIALMGTDDITAIQGEYLPIAILHCLQTQSVDLSGTQISGETWERRGWWRNYPGYAMNWQYCLRPEDTRVYPRKISQWSHPSTRIYITDGAKCSSSSDIEFDIGYFRWYGTSANVGTTWGVPAGRHNGIVNILYCAGNVSSCPLIYPQEPYTTESFKFSVNKTNLSPCY